METLLILLASVAMVWIPTLLVQDDPDDDGPPDAFPWGQYRSLDFYSH